MTPKTSIRKLLVSIAVALLLSATSPAQTTRALIERHVMRSLRQIQSAEATYQATTGSGSYASLMELYHAGLIDDVLATGTKFGYVFVITIPSVSSQYHATATPILYRKTGIRSFYVGSTDAELHGGDKSGEPANAKDPIVDDCTSGTIIENERCTIQDMRSLISAQATYHATTGYPNYGFINELYAAGLIRSGLSSGISRGYAYTVQLIDFVPNTQQASFKIWSKPFTYGITGVRSFYTDQTGVVRGADRDGGNADQNDPPVD